MSNTKALKLNVAAAAMSLLILGGLLFGATAGAAF
jgi:hypothetical protein